MIHLDPTTWGTVTWLIIAVASLFLMVIALFLENYENKKIRKFADDLLGGRIEDVRSEMQWIQNRLVEVEHCVDLEKDPLPFSPSTTERP